LSDIVLTREFPGQRSFVDSVRALEKKQLHSETGWINVGITNPSDPDYDISPPFQNGWSNIPDGCPLSFYLSRDGEVRMRGNIQGGPFASIVFTLPNGYCPEYIERFVVPSGVLGFHNIIEIYPNGNVVLLI